MSNSYQRLQNEYDDNCDVFEGFIETAYDEEIDLHLLYLDGLSSDTSDSYEGEDGDE